MRLISVQVEGYKRFDKPATLWVTSPLIAVVGPNEAGKTSLLEALEHLSRDAAMTRTEYTDRRQPEGNAAVVTARYAVERADRDALAGLLDEGKDYVLTIKKRVGEPHTVRSLSPALYRDTVPRQQIVKQLQRIVTKELLVERTAVGDGSDEEIVDSDLSDKAAQVAQELTSADEDLSSGTLSALSDLISAVRERHGDAPADRSMAAFIEQLDDLHAHEEEDNPHDRAGRALAARRPTFLFFRNRHRVPDTNYEWAEHETAPVALANLCHMAEVEYASYRSIALDRERREELQGLERQANATLARKFEAWTQAELSVEFRADHEGLQLQVFDKKALRNVPFDQRSAGLRYFVALVAFVDRFGGPRPPVLLIDEAETHLHYGGQADLMQVFARQGVAQTIIYTTHSIGCLPEDLGTTVRVAEPTGPERSELRDSFWEGGSGLTPLMLAMGATALAFMPSRFAVIGEGPSDAILLPSLLRAARDERYAGEALGFQVAPGLAHVARRAAAELELDAANVAYLHDADDGGRDHAAKLPERAHEQGRVFELGDGQEEGLCIEDLVDADLYTEAVNSVLSRTRVTEDRVEGANLPVVDRPGYLRVWCAERGLNELSKTFIAEDVVRLARERTESLVEPARTKLLGELYDRLRVALGVPGAPHSS